MENEKSRNMGAYEKGFWGAVVIGVPYLYNYHNINQQKNPVNLFEYNINFY